MDVRNMQKFHKSSGHSAPVRDARAAGNENAGRGTLYDRRSQRSGRGRFLADGCLRGPTIECDWHGWRFDVRTGACLNRAGSRIESYEVVIEDGWIKILI